MAMRSIVAAAAVLAAGCAALEPGPGFPVERPASLEPGGRSLAVVGDLQMTPWLVRTIKGGARNEREQRMLVADLRERLDRVAALAIVGDLVFNARSNSDWAHFDALIGPVVERVPVLPALGNHDYRCRLVKLCSHDVVPENLRLRFPWLEPGTPYEVAFGDVGLVFLASETRLESQNQWIASRLPAWQTRYTAVVAFVHRPPYTNTVEPEPEKAAAVYEQLVEPLVDSSSTPLVVSGHEHGYEHLRLDGVHFVITAGGGGPRDMLTARRPGDVYIGGNCRRGPSGRVLRPFNYLLIGREAGTLRVRVRGFCRDRRRVRQLASFRIPLESPSGRE